MPYPESEYPSILRGRSKRESQRLLAAAPAMLAALRQVSSAHGSVETCDMPAWLDAVEEAIAKAEGRE